MIDLDRARELRANGMSWERAAELLGTTEHKLRVAIDAGYMQRRRSNLTKVRQMQDSWVGKEAAKSRKAAGITFSYSSTMRQAEQDWRDRLAEIGPDDRGMTARLMGDPPSWRSALGRPAR